MNHFKLLVTDIDGTILPYGDDHFPKMIIDMFLSAKAQGMVTAVASGREMVTILKLLPQLEVMQVDYFIGANGSFIYDLKNKSYLKEWNLDFEFVKDYYHWTRTNYPTKGITVTDDAHIFASPEGLNRNNWFLQKYLHLFKEEQALDHEINHRKIHLITVTSRDEDHFSKNEEFLANYENGKYATQAHWSSGWFVAVANVNKYSAIESLASHLKIQNEDIIAFGDSENDIEMIAGVGHGVAMIDGTERARSSAHALTHLPCEEGGVAHYLDQLGLIKLK